MNAASFWGTLDSLGFRTMRILLSVLWQSSILFVTVALLACALRRRRAAVRHGVWIVALLVAPALPLLAWAASSFGTPQAQIPVMPSYSAPTVQYVAPPVELYEPAPLEPVPAPPVEVRASLAEYPWALALLAYAAGVTLLATLILVGRLRIGSWLRTGRTVTDPRVLAAFAAARERLALGRDLNVLESESVPTPMTVGTFRPSVLLPAGLAQRLSDAELRAVAVHELAHVRRKDALLLSLVSLVRAALFFHPLVWLGARQVSTLAEAACDDAVLDAGGEPVSYAKMLARLAEELPRRSISTELAAGIVLSKSAFLRRIEAILSERRDRIRKLSRLALAATLIGGLVSLGVALALPLGEKAGASEQARLVAEKAEEAEVTEPIDARSLVAGMAEALAPGGIPTFGPVIERGNRNRKQDVIEALRAAERRYESLWCTATVASLEEHLWDSKYLDDPAKAPWDSTRFIRETEWAFVGSPHRGMLYKASDGEVPWYKDPHSGRYAYSRLVQKVAFNGKYQTWLEGNGSYDDDGRLAGMSYRGAIRPERPPDSVNMYEIQGHTLWLSGSPLSECLEDGRAVLVRSELLEGRSTYRVDVSMPRPGLVRRVWLDPSRGLNIIRQHQVQDARFKEFETLQVQLAQWAPGVWLPKEIYFVGPNGRPLSRILVQEVRINQPTDKDFFSIDFPPGTDVDDRRAGAEKKEQKEVEEGALELSPNRLHQLYLKCKQYAWGHNDKWPPNLQALVGEDYVDPSFLINPRWPEREVGYTYLKPPEDAAASTIVLYESYDTWPDGGIVGGRRDGAVITIGTEAEFKKLLGAATMAPGRIHAFGAVIERQYVGRSLSESPVQVDLSTPEAAAATWNRAWITKDAMAFETLFGRAPSKAELEGLWKEPDPAVVDRALHDSQIVEVLMYRERLAGVITLRQFPEGEGLGRYRLRVFGLVDGNWENFGEQPCDSLEAAREWFGRKKEILWQDYRLSLEALGPVVELVVNEGAKEWAVDFDTGRVFSRPSDWPSEIKERLERIREAGIDAFAENTKQLRGLVGVDIIGLPIRNDHWEFCKPKALVDNRFLQLASPGTPVMISAVGEIPATFLIRTREGGMGILQITGFTEDPPGVKIRYKMVQAAAGPEAAESKDAQDARAVALQFSQAIRQGDFQQALALSRISGLTEQILREGWEDIRRAYADQPARLTQVDEILTRGDFAIVRMWPRRGREGYSYVVLQRYPEGWRVHGMDDSPSSITLQERLEQMVEHGADEPLRDEARRAVLKQRLHGLSHAIRLYAQQKGASPPDLETLEDWTDASGTSALGEGGLNSFNVGEQKVQYVIPESDAPDAAMLYHWPPYKGGTWLLYQNQELDWVPVGKNRDLINPRNRQVIRWGDRAEATAGLSFGPVIERVLPAGGVVGPGMFDVDRARIGRAGPFSPRRNDVQMARAIRDRMREFGADFATLDDPGEAPAHLGRGLVAADLEFVLAGPGTWWDAAPETYQKEVALCVQVQRQPPRMPIMVTAPSFDEVLASLPADKPERQASYIFQTREGGMGILQIVGFNEDPPGVKIRYKMVRGAREGAGQEDLQRLISAAAPGSVVTIPPGIYRQAIVVDRPLTLKGESPEQCILELTADEPCIMVSSKEPVIIDSLTIKWQLATSEKPEGPVCALAVKDGNANIRNCRFIALGSIKRCPSAVQSLGFSNVKLENCTFEGFEFTIGYSGGAEGTVTDCLVLNPGHCGITVYSGSTLDVARNIVTGSGYHGIRSTGGTLLAHDNLIIQNKNRGIYLGNKSARGRISNNVIMRNGTGISAFAQTDVTIENNLILDSDYAGLSSRDSCPITVRNNVFQGNTRGIIVSEQTGRNRVSLGQNSFWKNGTDTENIQRPHDSILVDPRFKALDQGDFSSQADELKRNKQGLSDPSVFPDLWKKWSGVKVRYKVVQREREAAEGERRRRPSPTGKPAEQPPRGGITGRVMNAVTGEPISGAYVAVDRSGDAGGANLERFRAQGTYATTETGKDGSFLLGGLAFMDNHPLIVTCPGYVRSVRTVAVRHDEPVLHLDIALQPGGEIVGRVVDDDGKAMAGVTVRLEAADGRLFWPMRADWPDYPWRDVKTDEEGQFSFGELNAGAFRVDAMKIALKASRENDTPKVTEARVTYVGAVPNTSVALGEATEVKISPAGAEGRIMVSADVPSAMPEGVGGLPAMAILSREVGPLEVCGGPYHLEDARLGRIIRASLVLIPFDVEGHAEFSGLPAGTYAVYVVTVEEVAFPSGQKHAAAFVAGEAVDLAPGQEVELQMGRHEGEVEIPAEVRKHLDSQVVPPAPFAFPDKEFWKGVVEQRSALVYPSGEIFKRLREEDRRVYEQLQDKVKLSFDATPLEQVVDFLQQVTRPKYVLLRQDLPPDGAPVTLHVETSVHNALDQICELTGMAWKVQGGLIKIGAPESLRQYEIRVYDVRDLLVSTADVTAWPEAGGRGLPPEGGRLETLTDRTENLILLIKQACGEGTWMPLPPAQLPPDYKGPWGRAFIRGSALLREPGFPAPSVAPGGLPLLQGHLSIRANNPGEIIIVQTAEVHECIERLLRTLRGDPNAQNQPGYTTARTLMYPDKKFWKEVVEQRAGVIYPSEQIFKGLPEEDRRTYEQLKEVRAFSFDATPLEQVVDFLQQVTTPSYVLLGQDVPPDGAPVTLHVETSVHNALDQICELTGMAWKVDGGVIKIGAPESLRVYDMRLYDVRDLLIGTEDLTGQRGVRGRGGGEAEQRGYSYITDRTENLILLIKQACGEGTWMTLPPAQIPPDYKGPRGRAFIGGTGFSSGAGVAAPSVGPGGLPLPQGRGFSRANNPGEIIILQTAEVHECIERLLRKLRMGMGVQVGLHVEGLVIEPDRVPKDEAAFRQFAAVQFGQPQDSVWVGVSGTRMRALLQGLVGGELLEEAKWESGARSIVVRNAEVSPVAGLNGTTVRPIVSADRRYVFLQIMLTDQEPGETIGLRDGQPLLLLERGPLAPVIAEGWVGDEAAKELDLEDCAVALLIRPSIVLFGVSEQEARAQLTRQQEPTQREHPLKPEVEIPDDVRKRLGMEVAVQVGKRLLVGGDLGGVPEPWKGKMKAELSPADVERRAHLFLDWPEVMICIQREIEVLSDESLAESMENLYQLNMFTWPGGGREGGGRLVIPGTLFPLEPARGEWDLHNIMSNRRFAKIHQQLSRMGNDGGAGLVADSLERSLARYRTLFDDFVEASKPHFRADSVRVDEWGGVSGPGYISRTVDEKQVTLRGARYDVLSLVWIAGSLGLTQCHEQVKEIAQHSMFQRDWFYQHDEFHDLYRSEVLEKLSLYNRQILAFGLTRTSSTTAAMQHLLAERGAVQTRLETSRFDASLTPYDLPVRAAYADPDMSLGTVEIECYAAVDDSTFDQLLFACVRQDE